MKDFSKNHSSEGIPEGIEEYLQQTLSKLLDEFLKKFSVEPLKQPMKYFLIKMKKIVKSLRKYSVRFSRGCYGEISEQTQGEMYKTFNAKLYIFFLNFG